MASFWIRRRYRARSLVITNANDPVILSCLGLHQKALASSLRLGDHRAGAAEALAQVTSLAATGKTPEAVEIALARSTSATKEWQTAASQALAPHAPEVALELLPQRHAELRAALLDRLGKHAAAAICLGRSPNITPDGLLLIANLALAAGDNDVHFALLNHILATFGLEHVHRHNDDLPLTLQNIVCAKVRTVRGPLVSVIMPARNTEPYIDIAICGLVSQSWKNLELIIIDDASVDRTADRVLAWTDRDPRIRFVRMQNPSGPYCAKNYGLQPARGNFVTFHDSDDWSHPRRIELQVLPLLENQALCATSSRWIRIDGNGRFVARQVWPLLRLNPSSITFRRGLVLDRIGVFNSVLTGADSEFWQRIHEAFGSERIRKLRLPLSLGLARSTSLVGSSTTGFGTTGINLDRLAYWESWHLWHAQVVANGGTPRIETGQSPFEPPSSIKVQPTQSLRLSPALSPRCGEASSTISIGNLTF